MGCWATVQSFKCVFCHNTLLTINLTLKIFYFANSWIHYFLVLKENEPTRGGLRKHDYFGWNLGLVLFNLDTFFPNQWTEEPKNKTSGHLAGFSSSKSYLSASTDWVEYSHNWASTGSLNLFYFHSLWLKLWCFGSLLSDLTLKNIQLTQPQMQLPSEKTRRRCSR